jgi:predicted Zn-dependent protease
MSMSERKRTPKGARPKAPPGAGAGATTTAEWVALLCLALVIGLSGGYLLFRFADTGRAPATAEADPGAVWRARLAQHPEDVGAMLGLAHVHLDRRELDAAEPLYRQVLTAQPTNVEAISHLGTLFLERGRVAEALAQYDRALAVQPDYVHALWDKALLLQQVTQDYPAAIRSWEAFRRVVGPDSQDAKTAQQFIDEARRALSARSPVEKAFDGKP